MALSSCDTCGRASHECECAARMVKNYPNLVGKRVALYKGTAEILEHSASNDRFKVSWSHPDESLPMTRWIDRGEIYRVL